MTKVFEAKQAQFEQEMAQKRREIEVKQKMKGDLDRNLDSRGDLDYVPTKGTPS